VIVSRGVLGSSLLVASGAAVLLWAALASREEPGPKAPSPKARRVEPAPADPEAPPAVPSPAQRRAAAAVERGSDDYGVLHERIQQLEERLLDLDLRRNALAVANQDLERQIREKSAESSARMMADWRVRSLEGQLGLSAAQKQALTELWTKWGREDAGRSADRASWLSREADIRSRLTAEQAAALHDLASLQARQQWSSLGTTLGTMVGASRDEQTRLQQTLGELPVPNTMLLPEAYGADWTAMMKQASGLVQPLLSSDQRAKLDRFVQR
jgi:hypothetical protein